MPRRVFPAGAEKGGLGMCGICGIVFDDPTRKVPEGLIGRMTDRLEHRGPDDRGAYEEPGVSLGHSRLSIIDLSAAGRQPMANEDGSLLVVFNGEIYNFAELREDLVKKGTFFPPAPTRRLFFTSMKRKERPASPT